MITTTGFQDLLMQPYVYLCWVTIKQKPKSGQAFYIHIHTVQKLKQISRN